jgi:hypothetical protein
MLIFTLLNMGFTTFFIGSWTIRAILCAYGFYP